MQAGRVLVALILKHSTGSTTVLAAPFCPRRYAAETPMACPNNLLLTVSQLQMSVIWNLQIQVHACDSTCKPYNAYIQQP